MRAANILGISIYPAEMERCLAIVTGAHASGDFHQMKVIVAVYGGL